MSDTPREIGTLIAVILKARNLPNKRHIGKQDPYCTLALNGEKRRTKAIKRGGQHPEWDEEVRFTLLEGDHEQARSDANSTPPPPPKKTEKGPPVIRGGKYMTVACYAEDIREPDFIGETKVDLTEALTKGETDEWFTLMNKDKYSGEVYLELTFWSNEPAPVRKVTPKPKAKKQYGGPGSFVPSGDSPPPANGVEGRHSRIPSISSFQDDISRDTIPASLRASNPRAQRDLYEAPYESSRSHHHFPSVDSVTSEFAELGVQRRRTSYPPSQNGYLPYPSSSIASSHSDNSQYSYGQDQGLYPDNGGSYSYDRPVTPTPPQPHHHNSLPSQYQPPYESNVQAAGYQVAARGPRYSIPPSSSGFMPIPATAPSGFASLSPQQVQPTGFASSLAVVPTGYAPPPSHTPPASTPAPATYGGQLPCTPAPAQYAGHLSSAPAPVAYTGHLSSTPAPATYAGQLSSTPAPAPYAPPVSHTPIPVSNYTNAPPAPSSFVPSTSYPQSLQPSQSSYSYQQYPPPTQPPQQSYPPPSGPPPNQQQLYAPPPPPPSAPPHSQSTPPQQYSGHSHMTPSPPHTAIPPPPPLNDNHSPIHSSGSRPLPQPTPQYNNQQTIRRQPSLPIPPSVSAGPFSPTTTSSIGVPPTISYNQIPPPPPPPMQQSNGPYPSNHQLPSSQAPPVPGPPPSLRPSSSMPVTYSTGNTGPVSGPPPVQAQQHSHISRRPSLPPPPIGYPQQQQQSAYQAFPPLPAPPSLPSQYDQNQLSSFPSTNSTNTFYPGPLPRPPIQYLPSNQAPGFPAPISGTDAGWR